MDLFLALVIMAIIAMVALLAWLGQRRNTAQGDQDNPDYHILHSEYQSGVGGGESRTWKVPKDPQAYARLFIPKDKDR
jgi:hypothetical protein